MLVKSSNILENHVWMPHILFIILIYWLPRLVLTKEAYNTGLPVARRGRDMIRNGYRAKNDIRVVPT